MKKNCTIAPFRILMAALLITIVFAAGCSTEEPDVKSITVFAAASTTNAITDIAAKFKEETQIEVITNFASSSTLAKQIESGADADVFVSANEKWADYLEEHKFSFMRESILNNRIVIVVPSDSDIASGSPDILLSHKIKNIAMGEPSGVPAGKYGKEALVKLGLWEEVESKVSSAKDVRSALAYVETKAAEAGIVYSTDSAITDKVKVAYLFPEDATNKPISYPAMVIEKKDLKMEATVFYDYLKNKTSSDIFKKYGFITKN